MTNTRFSKASRQSLSAMWWKQHQLPVFPCRNQGHQLMAIHPATATLDSLLHLHTITISNTFTSSSHSKTHENVSPLFWWIPRFSFMCCNKAGHFSMPVNLAKRPRFRIYMSQILFSSEIVDGLLGPNLRREKYLGFRTGSLLQHASPMTTLRKDSIWQQILERTRNSRISTTPVMEHTQAQMTFISVQLWPGVLKLGFIQLPLIKSGKLLTFW